MRYALTRALSNGDMSNDLDGCLTRISRSAFFEVEYLENGVF